MVLVKLGHQPVNSLRNLFQSFAKETHFSLCRAHNMFISHHFSFLRLTFTIFLYHIHDDFNIANPSSKHPGRMQYMNLVYGAAHHESFIAQ